MKVRILFGAVMIVGVVGVLWLDWFAQGLARRAYAVPVAMLLAAIGVVAFGEMRGLARAAGADVLSISGLAGVLVVATMPVWWLLLPLEIAVALGTSRLLIVLGLAAMAIFLEQMFRRSSTGAFGRIAGTALAVLYVGVGLGLILQIRVDFGVPELVLFLAAVKFTDIGAYFTGSAIGKHKLIPWLSPGKSWEGLAGGILTAAGVAAVVTWVLRIDAFGPPMGSEGAIWRTLVFGAVVGAAGQFADLCESLLKRSAGVKDSGALVPEFGGILDMLDSPLLASPVALILLNVLK